MRNSCLFFFVALLIFPLFESCNDRLELDKILFSNDLYLFTNNYDTNQYAGLNGNIKILMYADSTHCTTCMAKSLFRWKEFQDFADNHSNSFSIIFVVDPKKGHTEDVINIMADGLVDYPYYLDTAHSMTRLNPSLVGEEYICLLDSINNVVIEGDPIHDKRIRNNYIIEINHLINHYEK